jgi:hypothetical protein
MHAAPSSAVVKSASDPMMAALVRDRDDLEGLLAYSMYTQSREEWHRDFEQTFGRKPDAHEAALYELGERTERRKRAYRFLAGAKLAGRYADLRGTAKFAFIHKAYEMRADGGRARRHARDLRRLRYVAGFAATVLLVGMAAGFLGLLPPVA